MKIKQLYPNYGQDCNIEYFNQVLAVAEGGVKCINIEDYEVVTIVGQYMHVVTRDQGRLYAVGIYKIRHDLKGLQPVVILYDAEHDGKTPFFNVSKAITTIEYNTLISDPNVPLGGNDFWDAYLARCRDSEISLVTLDHSHTRKLQSVPWSEITYFDQCVGPDNVIHVKWQRC